MVQDLRYSLRTLRKNHGFILTVICTLALGIGANTAIFSLISGVLLRPLPFVDSDRLVQLNEVDLQNGIRAVSYPDLEAWRRQSSSFDGMIAYQNVSKDLQIADNPERIATLRAEPGLFRVLGVQAMIGRTFRDDDQPDVVVLSAGLWNRHFNSDPSCVGRKITLDGQPYTVIGVMPERFHFPYRGSFTDRFLSVELWIPWAVPLQWAHDPNYRVDFVVARLKSAIPLDVARRELSMIAGSGSF